MCSKVCFLMTWFCMRQIKVTFMQHNVVKIIWTFSRMKLGFLLHFYCCKATAKFHIEIFIGQIHLTHIEKVSCAMTRNRFWEILSKLHLAGNTKITEDRYYKVRVLFEMLNFNFKQYGSFVNQSGNLVKFYSSFRSF